MFIDLRHREESKRRRRGMFVKRGNDQLAGWQHVTPMGLAICSMSRFYKHFNPTGLESASHSPTSQV